VDATRTNEPRVADLLAEAEALEARAATERVAFLTRLFGDVDPAGRRLLDLGCCNGYAVKEWSDQGLDVLTRTGMGRVIAPFYPYLVVEIRTGGRLPA